MKLAARPTPSEEKMAVEEELARAKNKALDERQEAAGATPQPSLCKALTNGCAQLQ